MNKTFYICDGNERICRPQACYKHGGNCTHTSNIKHAKNSPEKRKFIKNIYGDNWEIE